MFSLTDLTYYIYEDYFLMS